MRFRYRGKLWGGVASRPRALPLKRGLKAFLTFLKPMHD